MRTAGDKALNAEAEAEKMEKSAKAANAHDHPVEGEDAVTESNMQVKRKD